MFSIQSAPLLVGLFLLVSASSGPETTTEPGAPPRDDKIVERTGYLSSWMTTEDGTVYFSLSATRTGGEETWFRTPPNQTVATRFQKHVLDVVLRFVGDPNSRPLVVAGEWEPRTEGQSKKRAINILRVGQ